MPVDIELLGDAHLKDLCGPKTLERGRTYATSGAVTVTTEDTKPRAAVHASVATEDGELLGDCDCPSAGDGWFCKHMVAVALVWRHRLTGTALAMDEAARRKVAASARRAANPCMPSCAVSPPTHWHRSSSIWPLRTPPSSAS